MDREKRDVVADYVAIDVETTGLDPKVEKIIEIGAVKVKKLILIMKRHELSLTAERKNIPKSIPM